MNAMRQRWRLLHERARNEGGFTLVEVISAMGILAIVGSIVMAGVGLGMRTMMNVGSVAVSESVAARAVADITESVSQASPILAMSQNRLVVMQDVPGRCERHQYVVATRLDGSPRSMQHIVQTFRTRAGVNCSDLRPSVWANATPTVDEIIVDNMVANPDGKPVFSYSAPGVARIPLPGDPNFDPTKAIYGPCDVNRVTVTISVKPPTEDLVQTLTSSTSPRSYLLGLRC